MNKELTTLLLALVIAILILAFIPLFFMFSMFQMHMQMMGTSFPLPFISTIFVVVLFLIFYILEKSPYGVKGKKVYVYPLTEKKIIEFLKQNGGKSEQKVIKKP